jgi:hypothetical protein
MFAMQLTMMTLYKEAWKYSDRVGRGLKRNRGSKVVRDAMVKRRC